MVAVVWAIGCDKDDPESDDTRKIGLSTYQIKATKVKQQRTP
jgi:hypothetical protein